MEKARFDSTIIDGVLFDDTNLKGTDFRNADIQSIYVYDEFDSKTTAVLDNRLSRQWLHAKGALVFPTTDINMLLGDVRYEAAREVAKTACKRLAGTFKVDGLSKGVPLESREIARDFADYLVKKGVLVRKHKSSRGGGRSWVVGVAPEHRDALKRFSELGSMSPDIASFFDRKK